LNHQLLNWVFTASVVNHNNKKKNIPKKFEAAIDECLPKNIHCPSSRLSPQKTPLRYSVGADRLDFQSLESLTIKDLLKGDFSFASKYSSETQEKILCKLLEDLNRGSERVKGCMYDPNSISKAHHMGQWVSEVLAVASEYSTGVGSWGADNLIGPPRTFPRYGDISTAWAPLSSSGSDEFLHLKFAQPVYICGVDIFETWNPGSVVRISAFDGQNWQTLWSGSLSQQKLPDLPRVFSPSFPCTTFKSDQILIDLDCTNSISWTEIDAIRLRGREIYFWTPKTHCRYPLAFRQIVYTFILCVNRLAAGEEMYMTEDVMFHIFKYLALNYIDC